VSSGRGLSPGEETSTSLLGTCCFLGVKKSCENPFLVSGVEEKRKEPPVPLVTGGIFPNCLVCEGVNGLGGLSVEVIGPTVRRRALAGGGTFFGGSRVGVQGPGEGGVEC
jgi:hypothetical protein